MTKLRFSSLALAVLFSTLPALPALAQNHDGSAALSADGGDQMAKARAALEAQWQADLAAAEARSDVRSMLRGVPAGDLQTAASTQMQVSATTTGGPYVCLPSCSVVDGRFLSLAGSGFNTFAGDEIILEFAAPASASSLEIGIFDPDTSGLWDLGSFGAGLGIQVNLFADPNGDASGFLSKGSWTFDSSYNAYDNAWFTITVPTGNDAKAASGNFFYTLHIKNPSPSASLSSNFKVRTNGSLALKPQAFAFMVPLLALGEAAIIYPSWPALSPTTYNGHFDIHFVIPAGQKPTSIDLWDGDMDYGSYDCSTADTANGDSMPPWAIGTAAVPEGVAVGDLYGSCHSTGSPADDSPSPIFRRSPSVNYNVVTPTGGIYSNTNPSGNLEWEKFHMTKAGGFPAGIYHIDLNGVDMANLNAWRFPYDVTCVKDSADPNAELQPCDFVYCPCCGTGTIGYWKNHASAWPRPIFTVGGVQYTVAQAITIMKVSPGGDKTYNLYDQLVAAMMNMYMGNDSSCISADINAANDWLVLHPVGSKVGASSAAWSQISASFTRLDQYNNGNLCARHRDDVWCHTGCND